MSQYSLEMPGIGAVKVVKKRGMKSIRLRILPDGGVVVSTPWFVSRSMVESFISQKSAWIEDNIAEYSLVFRSGFKFGQELVLHIEQNAKRNYSKLFRNGLYVKILGTLDHNNISQKAFIKNKMLLAIQSEAEELLLPKLEALASQTGHDFNQAYVKRLSSRWGSCDQDKNITLNIFLLQLPDELQDYVMLHELTHTIHMNHSKEFWDHMEGFLPEVIRLKKEIKVHHPRIEERI